MTRSSQVRPDYTRVGEFQLGADAVRGSCCAPLVPRAVAGPFLDQGSVEALELAIGQRSMWAGLPAVVSVAW